MSNRLKPIDIAYPRDAHVFPEILSHLLSQNVASHYSVQFYRNNVHATRDGIVNINSETIHSTAHEAPTSPTIRQPFKHAPQS